MENTKRLSELLNLPGKRLGSLRNRSVERASLLTQVRAELAPKLAESVVSAGLEAGRLTICVASAAWASRMRYASESLRAHLSETSGVEVLKVRIRVVPTAT